jgi:hypothetical protein
VGEWVCVSEVPTKLNNNSKQQQNIKESLYEQQVERQD